MPRRCVVVALVGGFVALVATAGRSQAPCGAVPYGSGAPGANAIVPDITITGLPLLGNAGFGYRVADVPGGAWTVHLLGIAPASTNVLGVEVLVDTPVVAGTFAASNGGAAFRLPLPSAPALTGLPLFAQTGALDPAAPQGISASAGLMVDLRRNNMLGAVSAYQGAAASDAFCAIHYLGNGRIIAGKRSSTASNRFLLSVDYGINWQVVGCPGSTGSHAYFFGADGATVFSGTGDTGNACLMRSDDSGGTWTVALTTAQIGALIGSADPKAVFGPVALGNGEWLVNIKSFDSSSSVIRSTDNGQTWQLPAAQPGVGPSSWARQMIRTGDGVLLWPEVLTDRMFRSVDGGASWSIATVPGAALFQPLCDAGAGVYLCGDASPAANGTIRLHRSLDQGLTWSAVAAVNLQQPAVTYWRDVIRAGGALYASACCVEGQSQARAMQLCRSVDDGATWCSLGNPFVGPYGGMQAIYQMCVTELGDVFAACQPDSTIVRWRAP